MIPNGERVKVLETFKCYDKKLIDQNEMKDIIEKNINIQISLAYFFVFKERCQSPDESLVGKACFLTADIEKEIDMFRKIFDKLSFAELYNGKRFCNVIGVDPCVMNLFLELKKEGRINEWLEYFTLREVRENCIDTDIIYGKFRFKSDVDMGEDEIAKQIEKMGRDPFFEYYLDPSINCIERQIIISGFTFEEIKRDKNILALSKMVDWFYIEVIDGYKFLGWWR